MQNNFLIEEKIKKRDFQDIITLIKNNPKTLDFLFKYEENKKSLLHIAVESGNSILTGMLLDKFKLKCNNNKKDQLFNKYINKKTKEGFTALYIAVENPDINIIKLLIKYDADPNIKSNKNESIYDIIDKRRKLDDQILEILKKDNKNAKEEDKDEITQLKIEKPKRKIKEDKDNKNELIKEKLQRIINIRETHYLNRELDNQINKKYFNNIKVEDEDKDDINKFQKEKPKGIINNNGISSLNRRGLDNQINKEDSKSIMEEEEKDEDINELKNAKPKGLINIRGTCYLNTVLQCFFHIENLSKYFLKHKKEFSEKPISKAYCSVILGLIEPNPNAFMPLEFKKAMQNINPNYDKFGNDPKDVAMDIIYNINEEMLGGESSFQLNNTIDRCNKKDLFDYYKNEQDRTKTIISESFGWMKQIEKKCNYCHKITYDFISEFIFIFNLAKIYKNNYQKRNIETNINNCFEHYFKPEKKEFTCQNKICNKANNNACVYNKICILPKYIFIILDRGKNDHFNCHVNFDVTLDIKKFSEQNGNENISTGYILIGATFLKGKSGAGHTVAFCRHFDEEYYLFDDSYCKKEKLKNLIKDKAFLLFYKRKEK